MRVKQQRRGATTVEFALVAIILFGMVFGIIQYGHFIMIRDLIDNAAREGARLAIVSADSGTDKEIQDTVTKYLAGQALSNVTIKIYEIDPATGADLGAWKGTDFGGCIAVQLDAHYSPFVPTLGLLPNPVKLRAKSIMRSEAN